MMMKKQNNRKKKAKGKKKCVSRYSYLYEEEFATDRLITRLALECNGRAAGARPTGVFFFSFLFRFLIYFFFFPSCIRFGGLVCGAGAQFISRTPIFVFTVFLFFSS